MHYSSHTYETPSKIMGNQDILETKFLGVRGYFLQQNLGVKTDDIYCWPPGTGCLLLQCNKSSQSRREDFKIKSYISILEKMKPSVMTDMIKVSV